MALPFLRERWLGANHIHFWGRSLHQPTDIGFTMGMSFRRSLQPGTIRVFVCLTQTTTASPPLAPDRHPTMFSMIARRSYPSMHLFRGSLHLQGGRSCSPKDGASPPKYPFGRGMHAMVSRIGRQRSRHEIVSVARRVSFQTHSSS
jgi:hypothetical protein